MGGRAISVLLCDDAPGFRALLRYTLEDDPDVVVVGEAGDGEAGLQAIADLRPDVVLLDIAMPRLQGLDAIAAMRARSPATRIVALSGFTAEEMAARALECGAHAYVEKGHGGRCDPRRDSCGRALGLSDKRARAAVSARPQRSRARAGRAC